MSTVHSSQRRRLLRLWSLPERVTSSSSCSRARTANRIGACSLWTARARPPEHPDLLRGCLRPRVRGRGVAVGPDEPRLHRGSWLHIWGAGSGRDDGRDAAGQDSPSGQRRRDRPLDFVLDGPAPRRRPRPGDRRAGRGVDHPGHHRAQAVLASSLQPRPVHARDGGGVPGHASARGRHPPGLLTPLHELPASRRTGRRRGIPARQRMHGERRRGPA